MRKTGAVIACTVLGAVIAAMFAGCGGSSLVEPTPSTNSATDQVPPNAATTSVIEVDAVGSTTTAQVSDRVEAPSTSVATATTSPPALTTSPPAPTTSPPSTTTTTEVVTLEPEDIPQHGFVTVEPDSA